MFINGFSNVLLIVLFWFSTGWYHTFSQGGFTTTPRESIITRAEIFPAPAAFTKISPANNATGISTSSAVLVWSSSSDNVTYQYCLRPNNIGKCPTKKWISVGSNTTATIRGLSSNTLYYWQVRAVSNSDGSVTMASGSWWVFRTRVNTALPSPFAKLAPADETTGGPVNGLVLSWAASTNATSYQYCFDTVNDNICNASWVNTAATRTATLDNLMFNQIYFWQVRAANAGGYVEADTGTWFNFTTTFGPPQNFSKKSPVNAAPEQPESITLEWDPSVGQNLVYEYCYDTTGGSTCQNTLNWSSAGTDTSAVISGLDHESIYSWQVRARNASGTTQANAGFYWNFTTTIAPPADFHKITPGIDADDQPLNPTLTWSESTGQNIVYEYCYTDTPSVTICDKVWNQAGASLQAALSGLKYNTLYSWQVRAVNSTATTYADDGVLSSFRTQIAPPSAFGKLSPTHGDIDQPVNITLNWSPSESASAYYYCIDEIDNDACDSGWVLNHALTTAAPDSLEYGQKTYYWQVYAANSEGEIEANNETWWSFTTLEAYPGDFTKLSPLNGAANVQLTPWLYWSDSPDVESYSYCINITPDCQPPAQWEPVDLNKSIQVPLTKNLKHNTQYFWQVRATNTTGDTDANNEWWSFTTIMAGPTSSNQRFENGVEDTPFIGALTGTSNYGIVFSETGSPPPGNLVLASNGEFSYSPPPNFEGTVSFNFIVSDGYNPPSTSYEATIVIQGRNDAPELTFLPDWNIKTRQLVSFNVIATDVDIPYDDSLTLSIVETLPPGATFNPDTGLFHWIANWTPTHTQPYTFTIRVEDDLHAVTTQEVQITVDPQKILIPMILK